MLLSAKRFNFIFYFLLSALVIGCGNDNKERKNGFSKVLFKLNDPQAYSIINTPFNSAQLLAPDLKLRGNVMVYATSADNKNGFGMLFTDIATASKGDRILDGQYYFSAVAFPRLSTSISLEGFVSCGLNNANELVFLDGHDAEITMDMNISSCINEFGPNSYFAPNDYSMGGGLKSIKIHTCTVMPTAAVCMGGVCGACDATGSVMQSFKVELMAYAKINNEVIFAPQSISQCLRASAAGVATDVAVSLPIGNNASLFRSPYVVRITTYENTDCSVSRSFEYKFLNGIFDGTGVPPGVFLATDSNNTHLYLLEP